MLISITKVRTRGCYKAKLLYTITKPLQYSQSTKYFYYLTVTIILITLIVNMMIFLHSPREKVGKPQISDEKLIKLSSGKMGEVVEETGINVRNFNILLHL